jgi:hypothetical protein
MGVQPIGLGQHPAAPRFRPSAGHQAACQNLLMPFGNLHNPRLDCISGKRMDALGIKTRKSGDNRLKCL